MATARKPPLAAYARGCARVSRPKSQGCDHGVSHWPVSGSW